MRRLTLAIVALSLLTGCGISAPGAADCSPEVWESFNVDALPSDVVAQGFKVTCANGHFEIEVNR
jgi:major membrane immunogen (membrane-anchored lipoprotein)